VYGWEVFEATHNVWSKYVVGEDRLRELLNGNKLRILASDDGSGAIMGCQGFPILFLTDEALRDFAELNQKEMTHEYFNMSVENVDGLKVVVGNSQYAFIDTNESRYVCKCNDLLKIMA
jgi:hypothetical protein